MSEEAFKPGDMVQLRSGGPVMTVQGLRTGDVICVWFDKTKQTQGVFNPAMLARYQRPRPMTFTF